VELTVITNTVNTNSTGLAVGPTGIQIQTSQIAIRSAMPLYFVRFVLCKAVLEIIGLGLLGLDQAYWQ
jgi:hypothetical protein